jgi:hypothetical protein
MTAPGQAGLPLVSRREVDPNERFQHQPEGSTGNDASGSIIVHEGQPNFLSANLILRGYGAPPRRRFHVASLPPWQADGVVEDYAHYDRGEAAAIATGVKDATGAEPRAFAAFARDYAAAFS